VTQRPPEQSRVHEPEGGHVSAQLPPEQSVVHGGAPQEAAQLPPVQLHAPPRQGALVRLAAVPGSETAGPPFGDVPGKVVLEPPHATSQVAATTEEKTKARTGATSLTPQNTTFGLRGRRFVQSRGRLVGSGTPLVEAMGLGLPSRPWGAVPWRVAARGSCSPGPLAAKNRVARQGFAESVRHGTGTALCDRVWRPQRLTRSLHETTRSKRYLS